MPSGAFAAHLTTGDLWLKAAGQDYRLCRAFADRFRAGLPRSLRSQRVGWERAGQPGYALLVPDIRPATSLGSDEWYLYSVTGEAFFRWTHAQRQRMKALVLADCVEDWAELLRQAVRERVFEMRYEVTPQYLNALGEYEAAPVDYLFSLLAYAPRPASAAPFEVFGSGLTPEAAARDACLSWLQEQCPDINLS
ncbi:MAG: hypothetical protein JO250_06310 [Armatimonadetes bacterium]|nr:hypothetical protein [Armatimonadota bacterium]